MMRFLPSLLAVQAMGAGMDPTSACEAALRPILSFYPDATGSLVCLRSVPKKRGGGESALFFCVCMSAVAAVT